MRYYEVQVEYFINHKHTFFSRMFWIKSEVCAIVSNVSNEKVLDNKAVFSKIVNLAFAFKTLRRGVNFKSILLQNTLTFSFQIEISYLTFVLKKLFKNVILNLVKYYVIVI